MNNEILFNYNNENDNFIYDINDDIILHIKRFDKSMANLYFTDKLHFKIKVPSNIIVYTYDINNNKIIYNLSNNMQYVLYWINNYDIEYNNNIILKIKSERFSSIYA
jgi:hypothetical protein